MRPAVSIVIPVWRDVTVAGAAAESSGGDAAEIIAAGSWEDAGDVAQAGAQAGGMRWVFARRGRGQQMNAGAAAASGDWLLFLHADTRLPRGWLDEIQAAGAHGCGAGCFRLGIDAKGWRPRLWEHLVRLRVALGTLPYGDQAVFVRRDLFVSLGGFRDLPLMEDVEFVLRVRRATRLWKARRAVRTSGRRWEAEGWFRRSVKNLVLVSRYRLGTDVRRLARAYTGRRQGVAAMLARAPSATGKTRLGATGPELRRALLLDTWDAVRESGLDAALLFTPEEAAAECATLVPGPDRLPLLAPQHGHDLGARMHAASADLFAAAYERVVLIGSDLPTLPPDRLREADSALRDGADVVLGPSDDGGYYLVGLRAPQPALFRDIQWGAPDVFTRTLARARSLGLRVATIGSWYDVDSAGDLDRVAREQTRRGARTRDAIAKR
ncbi:hypothetical protein BH23ACI1_BH23ACI1_22450 [soil metagenome]